MNLSRLDGPVALLARAQLLANDQRRTWFLVRSTDAVYATADVDDVPTGAVVAKLIPGAPAPTLIRV
jgi:hypothetical protein